MERHLIVVDADELRRLIGEAIQAALPTPAPAPVEQMRTYSVDETCKILKVARATFFNWAAAGTLPTIKAGRRTLVDADKFDEALRSGRIGRYVHSQKRG